METVNRIVPVFPPYQQKQIRIQLAGVIKVGIICQRLLPTKDGKGRVPAIEVLVSTSRVRECIEDKERQEEIPDAISKGYTTYGMQTFDQSLLYLLHKDLISYDEALRQATNPDDFVLKVKGITDTGDGAWKEMAAEKQTPSQKPMPGGGGGNIERF